MGVRSSEHVTPRIRVPLTNELVPKTFPPHVCPPLCFPVLGVLLPNPGAPNGDSSCRCMCSRKRVQCPTLTGAKARCFHKRTRSELGGECRYGLRFLRVVNDSCVMS